MNNPYVILNISQSATNEEIEKARKKQLKQRCSVDENIKNENGEYLSNVINQAADDLLNLEKRKKIDDELNNKNVPGIYRSSNDLSNVILTGISNEIMNDQQKIVVNKSLFSKKVKCKKLYVGVLSNNDCLYLLENFYYDEDCERKCCLNEYFSKKTVTCSFDVGNCPWDNREVFIADGLLALAYPAYQLLPNSVIRNGKISDDALRKILLVIKKSIRSNADQLQQLFELEQEKIKVYKK